MNPRKPIALSLLLLASPAMVKGGESPAMPPAPVVAARNTPVLHTERTRRWTEARFGMFVHFGIYAVPGRGEWVQWNEQIPVEEYAKLADQFKPEFGPENWAQAAKAAGMKYIVFTSRHHDGFAMFDSKAGDFNSVKTAAHRDFVAEYVKAARKAGLYTGLYYSPLDWRFPGYFLPDVQRKSAEAMRAQYHTQMEELLCNYGPLDILWFDGGGRDWLSFGGDWKGAQWVKRSNGAPVRTSFTWEDEKVEALMKRLQPKMIFNGRVDLQPDFLCREGDGALGRFDNEHPWELCTTLAGAWGYQKTAKVKTLAQCIQLLANTAGRDGNLLLNVGPRPDGQIDPPQVERLREIGQWLGKYGESIYGTRGGPFLPGDYGVSTRKANTVYVHVLHWPKGNLVLPTIPAKVVSAKALTGGKATFTQSEAGIELSLPEADRNEVDTLIALELDQPAGEIKVVNVP
jgi:alpha-L-fucosidase